jgi:hypothetical protein
LTTDSTKFGDIYEEQVSYYWVSTSRRGNGAHFATLQQEMPLAILDDHGGALASGTEVSEPKLAAPDSRVVLAVADDAKELPLVGRNPGVKNHVRRGGEPVLPETGVSEP